MDILLFAVALIISFSVIATSLASVGFLAFLFLLAKERFQKTKVRSLVLSDFISAQSRLSV
jgi:hypothetical protein